MDPPVKQSDLLGYFQSDRCLGCDVGGESFEVEAVVAPDSQGGLGGGDDRGSSFPAACLATVVLEPPGQTSRSQPFHLVRVGIAGEELEGGSGHPGPERADPSRSEDLQQ